MTTMAWMFSKHAAALVLLLAALSLTPSQTAFAEPQKDAPQPPPGVDSRDRISLETLGPLRLGMEAMAVIEALGGATSQTDPAPSAVDGLLHEKWNYPAYDASLELRLDLGQQQSRVISIRIGPRSTFKTGSGIGVGSGYTNVAATYALEKNEQGTSEPVKFTAGSDEDKSLVFSFENGKVTQILFGRPSE